MSKKILGQFNTTRKDYILEGFEHFLKGKDIVDPFMGHGDLLSWAKMAKSQKGYDIDPNRGWLENDSLLSPIDYSGLWVLTNPPYLARNKNPYKQAYDVYGEDDLYKCAIRSIFGCEGGILIVPLNFFSSEGSARIRRDFFARYAVHDCKAFEQRVFDDTDYTVCAFSFAKSDPTPARTLPITFLPSEKVYVFEIQENNGWVCGKDWFEFIDRPTDGIGRWTVDNCVGDKPSKVCVGDVNDEVREMGCDPRVSDSILLLRAIDTGAKDGRIRLTDIREHGVDCVPGKLTSRNYAHIRFDSPPSLGDQASLIGDFNRQLEHYRDQYNSIFLTAFRNSTAHYSRKRIGFDAAYKMISRLLS